MKNYAIIAFALVSLLAFSAFALAEEAVVSTEATQEEAEISAEPGITPDSAFYGLKLGWEKLGVAFTFNQEKKAQKELALAKKRLMEMRKMAEKGNVKAMERAQQKHDALIENAQARLALIQEDTTETKAKLAAEKVIGIERALKAHQNRIEVLQDILAEKNLSDEARTAIESAIERMENRTKVMEQKLEERKERVKTRLRAITEKSEQEINAEFEKIENSSGYTEALKKIAEKRIQKTEQAIERVKSRISEEEANGINLSAAKTHVEIAEQNLEKAKSLYQEGKYKEAIATIKPVSNYGRNLNIVVKAMHRARMEGKNPSEISEIEKTQIRERVQERIKEMQNLSPAAKQEIKSAIREKVQEQIQERAKQSIKSLKSK
ncbi:MAG: DUF5667 domain-containing protein [Candidatus Pacearchaeota archaeon]|nr:DUF5667 domain-containing protein [Candidatus Pacearchaeota archaeon]